MPTPLPEPKPQPPTRPDSRTGHRTGSAFFLGALVAGIPLVAHTGRVERRAAELEKNLAAANSAVQAARSSVEIAERKSQDCLNASDRISTEELLKARSEMCAVQLDAVSKERDRALERAACKNRHVASTLPTFIASLVDAENNRADACRLLAHSPTP